LSKGGKDTIKKIQIKFFSWRLNVK
jgi:hypothetical protein